MAENRSVVLQYDVKVDLSDETGTLLACILRPEVMERYNIFSKFSPLIAQLEPLHPPTPLQ